MSVPQELSQQLEVNGQSGTLRFWDELDDAARAKLQQQLGAVDLDLIRSMLSKGEAAIDWNEVAKRAQPPHAFRLGDTSNEIDSDAAQDAGQALLDAGKVGMILVAGGQGTRLGFPKPKGMFPIGPVSNRTLFQVIIDQLRARSASTGHTIPLFVMTSPATHNETVEFLASKNHFGMPEGAVRVFCQGTMPAVDAETGELLLESKDSLALSPDGHGGMLAAFSQSGCLEQCAAAGIEHLFYAQIDNPLATVCDPALLGYHALSESDMTTQVVKKQSPLERVGNVVQLDGKVQIIEYSDLPDSIAEQTDEQGQPRLWAGNIAVHVFRQEFLERANNLNDALPFHIALKKVPCLDSQGIRIEPAEPNAMKFERFIFDLLPYANNAIAVEAEKSEAFAPVKNADGAETDTPELAKRAILNLHRKWLDIASIELPENIDVEIDPMFAIDASELQRRKMEIGEIQSTTFLTNQADDQ